LICAASTSVCPPAAPAELLEPVQALNGMLARLDDSVQRLSQFSADLAHEIRTPLHTLLASNGQALNHPRSTAEYQELLASNMEEFERLKRMAENLMFLARAEQAERARLANTGSAQPRQRAVRLLRSLGR
jgi:two-component system heavy metal sensor histidine kinase CusS